MPGPGDQLGILRAGFGGSIGAVGQQGVMQRTLGAGQVMHLQPLNTGIQIGDGIQQHRHRHKATHLRRNAFGQLQPRQAPWRHHAGDDQVYQRAARLERRGKARKAKRRNKPPWRACQHPGKKQRQPQNGETGQHRGRQIPRQAQPCEAPPQPLAQRGPVADTGLQRAPPRPDQPMTRIARSRGFARCGECQRGLGHRNLVHAGATGERFNLGAIQVAGGEIHRGETGCGFWSGFRLRPQPRINRADALKEIRPVHFRDQAHAGDDVTHGDVRGALPVLGALHHLVHADTLLTQALLQPCMQRGLCRVEPAQPLRNPCGLNFGNRRTVQRLRRIGQRTDCRVG